jgi:hypothetical protein
VFTVERLSKFRSGRGKFLAAAFWTWRRYFGRHWTRKTFSVTAGNALPCQRFLLGSVLYAFEDQIGLVAN